MKNQLIFGNLKRKKKFYRLIKTFKQKRKIEYVDYIFILYTYR